MLTKRKGLDQLGTLFLGLCSLCSDLKLLSQLPGKGKFIMDNWIPVARLIFLSLILLVGAAAPAQTVTTLHDFGSRHDGENPQSGVVFDEAGSFTGPRRWAA